MKTKIFGTSFAAAGAFLMIIGFYYLIIKAGIPYQDPTVEMQIIYLAHVKTGEALLKYGAFVTICGILTRFYGRWKEKRDNS